MATDIISNDVPQALPAVLPPAVDHLVTKGRTTHGCAGSMPAVCRLPRDKSERRPSGNAPTAWRNNYGSVASSHKNHDDSY